MDHAVWTLLANEQLDYGTMDCINPLRSAGRRFIIPNYKLRQKRLTFFDITNFNICDVMVTWVFVEDSALRSKCTAAPALLS